MFSAEIIHRSFLRENIQVHFLEPLNTIPNQINVRLEQHKTFLNLEEMRVQIDVSTIEINVPVLLASGAPGEWRAIVVRLVHIIFT